MNDSQWPPPFQPEERLTVTLEAQEWNIVLAGVQELPMRVGRQVFDKMIRQIERIAQQLPIEGNDVSH